MVLNPIGSDQPVRKAIDRVLATNTLLSGDAKHRNRRLAESFQLLGLVERAGMGVPLMYRHQLENGRRPPEYRAEPYKVRLSIRTDSLDERLATYIAGKVRAGADSRLANWSF